jgi:hypothetical protein
MQPACWEHWRLTPDSGARRAPEIRCVIAVTFSIAVVADMVSSPVLLARSIHRRREGNPLYIVTLVGALVGTRRCVRSRPRIWRQIRSWRQGRYFIAPRSPRLILSHPLTFTWSRDEVRGNSYFRFFA